jgi:hypothetical protein
MKRIIVAAVAAALALGALLAGSAAADTMPHAHGFAATMPHV